jgi:tetratricopeptide (TPR) repeat protein
MLDRALVIATKDVDLRAWRALVELDWKADPKPLHDTIRKIVSENPVAAESVTDVHLFLAFCERDPTELRRALAAYPAAAIGWDAMKFPRAWYEGVAERILGDANAAAAAFSVARMKLENSVQEQPDHAPIHSMLGMVYAGLGLKDAAIREGERAVELLPVSKDSINGAHVLKQLAIIYAWTGEKDRAITRLSEAVRLPGRLTYGELKLHPYWDPLRGDPRFEEIVASMAPKE